MKRFYKVVEDILLGKYGIAWNVDGYYIIYRHFLSDDRKKVSYGIKFNTQVKLFELLGVLEHELTKHRFLCGHVFFYHNCQYCNTWYRLSKAIDIVRAEIKRIQEGGVV